MKAAKMGVSVMSMDRLHGSNKLQDGGSADLSPAFAPDGSDCLIMGVNSWSYDPSDRYRAPDKGVLWYPAIDKGHAFTFGTTQTGKGVGSLIPALLSYGNAYGPNVGGGIFCISPKGEEVWMAYQRRVEMGQKVVVLDPWGEVAKRFGYVPVSTFNPLARLDPTSPDLSDEVASLSNALVVNAPADAQPHWANSARELVGGLIAAVVEGAPGVASLDDVRILLQASDKALQGVIEDIIRDRPGSLGARKLARFASGGEEVASIRSTASTQTAILDTVRLMSSMQSGSFDLGELADGATVFVVLPIDKLETHGRWLRLLLSMALDAVSRRPHPPRKPVLFLVDEMGVIGRLEKLETAVGLLSSVGIRIWGFLQNLGQLKDNYPSSWETFLANASFIQITAVSDNTTALYFSQALGTTTLKDVSTSQNSGQSIGSGGLHPTSSVNHGQSTSVNYHELNLMLPGDFRSLGGDELVVIAHRGNYYRIKKMIFYRDPGYAGRFPQNPRHALVQPRQTRAEWEVEYNAQREEDARREAKRLALKRRAETKSLLVVMSVVLLAISSVGAGAYIIIPQIMSYRSPLAFCDWKNPYNVYYDRWGIHRNRCDDQWSAALAAQNRAEAAAAAKKR